MRTILEYTENNLIYMDRTVGRDDPGSCFLESLPKRKEGGEKGQRRTEGWKEILQLFRKQPEDSLCFCQ